MAGSRIKQVTKLVVVDLFCWQYQLLFKYLLLNLITRGCCHRNYGSGYMALYRLSTETSLDKLQMEYFMNKYTVGNVWKPCCQYLICNSKPIYNSPIKQLQDIKGGNFAYLKIRYTCLKLFWNNKILEHFISFQKCRLSFIYNEDLPAETIPQLRNFESLFWFSLAYVNFLDSWKGAHLM